MVGGAVTCDCEEPGLERPCGIVGVAGAMQMDERVLIHVGEVGGVGEPAAQPAEEQRADVLEDGAVGLAVAGLCTRHPARATPTARCHAAAGPRDSRSD